MRVLAIVAAAVLLAGCGLPRLDTSVGPRPETRARPCPPVPDEIRLAAGAPLAMPAHDADRERLTGDAVIGDLTKAQHLADMIAIYDRCRARATPKQQDRRKGP